MSFQPALGQSRAAVPTARLRAVLGSLLLLTMVLVPLGVSSVAVAAPAGFDWTIRASAANNYWNSVAYGNGLFVAVSFSGTGDRVMTSPDGITWTSRTSAADNAWASVTYGNGIFVAVANDGAANGVMTSPDGITWTSRLSAAANGWFSVTYGNGLFVAVSYSGSGNRVMTSPDGITWTSRTSAANNNWYSVTYGNGLFVAVASSGTGNRVMTSPDGITWTIRASAADNFWYSVTYGNGLFVAVSADFSGGIGNRVMTSLDGITWTSRTSAADNQWRSVTYGGGLFVAVAASGTGNRVMTSPDGITWTSRTSAADNFWNSVAYGGGTFVAVSSIGTGLNQVMTSVWSATAPGVPVITGVSPGETSAAVAFTADDSGGSTITRLEFALDDTTAVDDSTTSMSSPYTLTNLSPLTPYTVYMRAVNTAGTGPWSAPQAFVTLSPPAAPVITGAVAGETSAAVAFTADDSGGSTITRLEFALDDTTAVDDSTASLSSPYTLTNLSPGTAYTVYMRAVSASGTGPWSAPRSFTTLDVPGAPVITAATAGQTSAAVAFTADDSGGSTITRLEFALDDTTAVDDSTASLSSPYTLSNLSPGTAYTVYMRAVNTAGTGPWSAPQGFATSSPPAPPSPPNPVVFPPGAPTGLTAVAGDASASVSWVAPSDSGSFPVTDYEVAPAPIGGSCLVKAPATSCEVKGLANGTSYTFTVRALNGAGWGAWSAPSNAVTPSPSVVKAIQITGSRDASDTRVVRVSGTTTDLVGEQVTPWIRFPGQAAFSAGFGVRTVAADGTFEWSRRTGKKVYVYFIHGPVRSNTVTIAAR